MILIKRVEDFLLDDEPLDVFSGSFEAATRGAIDSALRFADEHPSDVVITYRGFVHAVVRYEVGGGHQVMRFEMLAHS
jgi:hypothetical protein